MIFWLSFSGGGLYCNGMYKDDIFLLEEWNGSSETCTELLHYLDNQFTTILVTCIIRLVICYTSNLEMGTNTKYKSENRVIPLWCEMLM